ncbi:hypothetical protein MTBPR1_50142 [Candidatus Terasakiella magnetica]|uniref:Uncharacterized protein n=1 Tax=Candidatus Terasakiella magnetica TaxID=1867952 RepID=A0A1C3RJE4_9PROT|nr:DciA family protein [Candidatus Terasakiella magnetica]SCA57386.1 hypothetical protein MTBPR1_50142 [Candidatus Terasakiella magnetica]
MSPNLEDFLTREERRRNRSLSKRFRAWLSSEKAQNQIEKLERALAKSGGESTAVQLLKKAEEAYKADDAYKRQDAKRKKSLKQFKQAFEDWLSSDRGQPYQKAILIGQTDEAKEMARLDAEKAFARANPHLLPDDYRDASKTRIRPVRHAFAKGVEELTFDVIEPGLNQLGLVGANILRNWDKIVGSALAQNTRPERVTFPPKGRTNGTLFIKARQGFNTIIQHNSNQIVFRINSHFGFKAITEVRISKRYYDESSTTGEKIAHNVLAARIQPANELNPQTAKLVNQIKDKEMKKAFEELGKLIKARNG